MVLVMWWTWWGKNEAKINLGSATFSSAVINPDIRVNRSGSRGCRISWYRASDRPVISPISLILGPKTHGCCEESKKKIPDIGWRKMVKFHVYLFLLMPRFPWMPTRLRLSEDFECHQRPTKKGSIPERSGVRIGTPKVPTNRTTFRKQGAVFRICWSFGNPDDHSTWTLWPRGV